MPNNFAASGFWFLVSMILPSLCLSLAVFSAGCQEERTPGVSQHRIDVNPNEKSIVAEIEKIGGEVTVDEKSRDHSVIDVRLTCCRISDAWLTHLNGLTKLQSLSINGTNVTDEGLKHLRNLTNLQELSLYDTFVTDVGLKHLKGLTNLRMLVLSGTDRGPKSPGGKSALPRAYSSSGQPRLDSRMGMPGTNITDAGLEHLEGLTNLQWLSLDSTNISDSGLIHLKRLTNLGTLNLSGTNVGDAGLENLKGLTKLQDLNLKNTNVTDAGLVHLKRLTSLQSLDLGGSFGPRGNSKVTDAGLEQLKGLTNLFLLDLWGTQVSARGVKELQQALPKCRIDSPDGTHEARVPYYRELIPGSHYWRLVPLKDHE